MPDVPLDSRAAARVRFSQGATAVETLVVMGRPPRSGRGAAGRSLQLLRTLRSAGCQTHVVAFAEHLGQQVNFAELREVCRWLHLLEPPAWGGNWVSRLLGHQDRVTLRSDEASAKIAQIMPQCRLVVCCETAMHTMVAAHLPPRIREGMDNPDRPFYLIDLQESHSRRLHADSHSYWGPSRWWMRADANRARQLEVEAAREADLMLVSTHIDLQALADRAPMATLWEVANGVDPDAALSSIGLEDMSDALLFLGDPAMPHHARAAVWLARQVMPLVRQSRDTVKLKITGTDLPWCVRRLGKLPWVELLDQAQGQTQPLSVTMAQCVAGVATQRDARGATDHVLSMMAAGRPVVATMNVAMSLPGEAAAGPTPADRAEPIAEAVVNLLRDRKLAARQGQRNREFVASAATWEVQWRRVAALVQRLAEDPTIQLQSDSPGKRHPRVKGRLAAAKSPAAGSAE
jgi:hypothetical protein